MARGLTFLLAILALASPSAVRAQPSRGGSLPTVTLQLKWLPQAQFDAYYVALDRGLYRREGLNVIVKPGGPSILPENVVRAGRADIGVDWLSSLLVARDQGAPLVNIAQIFQATGMRIIAFKSTGIKSVGDLKGHRVSVWGAGNQYQFYALMSKYHMSPPQRYMRVLTQGFTMGPFLSHQVGAAHAMTYNELGVVYEHRVRPDQLTILDFNKLGVTILEDCLFARSDWARAHSDLVVRFLRASIAGWRWSMAHPDRAARITYRHIPTHLTTLPHQIYMARQIVGLIHYGPGLSHPIGYMDPASYDRSWRTLLAEGVIHAPPRNAYTQTYWSAAVG